MTEIAGSTILITGGGMGIGRLMGLGMGRLGGRIVLWDIDGDALDEATREIKGATGRDAYGYVCDVTDHDTVAGVADQVRTEVGEPDIVINNAGVVSGKRFTDLEPTEIERTFGVNTLALYWVTRQFLPAMLERDDGHLVTIASAAAFRATARQTDYAASKAAAFSFDESLRYELGDSSVRTTVICPYYINTGMFEGVETRFPRLFPIMEERTVVRRIVQAILKDRRRLVMPKAVLLDPLTRWLPPVLQDPLIEALGMNDAMNQFKGRTSPTGEQH
jgi:all-trans-retinol dehydrogenase (NAD+)